MVAVSIIFSGSHEIAHPRLEKKNTTAVYGNLGRIDAGDSFRDSFSAVSTHRSLQVNIHVSEVALHDSAARSGCF